MVPQMIVAVAYGDVECDPPEELFEIGSDMILGAMRLQKLREIKIACPFALILTQKCHRGSIEAPASGRSIEAPHAEGMVVAVEATQLRLRYVDSSPRRKSLRECFPRPDIACVVGGWKLRDPQTAVSFREARFRSRAA